MTGSSYLFIGDLIEAEGALPLQLFDDFYLKPASENQIKRIKAFITDYVNILAFEVNKFEFSFKPSDKYGGEGHEAIPLPENEWKYLVIEHSKPHAKELIQYLFSLSSLDLTILFEWIGSLSGLASSHLKTINYFHDSHLKNVLPSEIKKITKESIEELKMINSLLTGFDKAKFPLIDKALSDFVSIKDISERSPFKILSCFSILELLLTTYRQGTNDNSLSGQLQKKITLLNNQSNSGIDISKYFTGSDTNTLGTIIDYLYRYRNDIAHGNLLDFEKKLKLLRGQQDKILPFLLDLLRRVLITSLEQPQLISDLKEC